MIGDTAAVFNAADLTGFSVRMLSGHAALDSVVDPINRGEISPFHVKPWSEAVLREGIRDAFRRCWSLRSKSLEEFKDDNAGPVVGIGT